jgi:hypothetical protein
MFEDRGSRAVCLFTLKKPVRRDICLPMYVLRATIVVSSWLTRISCINTLRLHTAAGSSSAALGFPACLWCSFERPLCYCAIIAHQRRGDELVQVRSASFFFLWKRFLISLQSYETPSDVPSPGGSPCYWDRCNSRSRSTACSVRRARQAPVRGSNTSLSSHCILHNSLVCSRCVALNK